MVFNIFKVQIFHFRKRAQNTKKFKPIRDGKAHKKKDKMKERKATNYSKTFPKKNKKAASKNTQKERKAKKRHGKKRK